MPDLIGETERLLDLLRLGDDQARNDLIDHACERLRCLTRRMLRTYPGVQRWEQTDDVLQNALLRLCRALEATKPESVRHFYNLAALQIRRELIDLAHHHMGPLGAGAHHHTDHAGKAADEKGGVLNGHQNNLDEPLSLDAWTAFHESVGSLPDEEREVFNLLWYEELTQEKAGEILDLSIRTVKRRWQSARLLLVKRLSGAMLP